MTPAARYKAFQRVCSLIGSPEDAVARLIADRMKDGRSVKIRATNAETGLEFLLLVDSFSTDDEYRVRFYECHPAGNVEIMAREVRTTKPKRSRASRPGLSEITGAVVVLAIAAGAGTAFYASTLDAVEHAAAGNAAEIHAVKLTGFADGNGTVRTVYAEMVILVRHAAPVSISGDLADTTLFNGTYTESASPRGDGVLMRYSDIVNLTSPKSSGDYADVILHYGDQSRVHAAVIGG